MDKKTNIDESKKIANKRTPKSKVVNTVKPASKVKSKTSTEKSAKTIKKSKAVKVTKKTTPSLRSPKAKSPVLEDSNVVAKDNFLQDNKFMNILTLLLIGTFAFVLTALLILTIVKRQTSNTNIVANLPTRIVYSYQDASVPPLYHRSYKISITAQQAELLVTSYDEEINRVVIPMNPTILGAVYESFKSNKISTTSEIPSYDDGCVGGTSESLVVEGQSGVLFNANRSSCGGTFQGDLTGQVSNFADLLKSLFDDFDTQLKR